MKNRRRKKRSGGRLGVLRGVGLSIMIIALVLAPYSMSPTNGSLFKSSKVSAIEASLLTNQTLEATLDERTVNLEYSGEGLLNLNILSNIYVIFQLPEEWEGEFDSNFTNNINATYDVPGVSLIGIDVLRSTGSFDSDDISYDEDNNQVILELSNLINASVLSNESFYFNLQIELDEKPLAADQSLMFGASTVDQLLDLSLLDNQAPSDSITVEAPEVIVIDSPMVNPVDSDDTEVTGTGDAGNTVEVTLEDGTTESGTVDSNGDFAVEIPMPAPGDTLSVVQEDGDGNESEAVEVTVTDADSVEVEAPTVNPVDSDDTEVTGTGDAGNTVEVTLEDGTTESGTVDSNGDFAVEIPMPAPGDTLSLIQEDGDGNESEAVEVTVTDADNGEVEAPTVDPVDSNDTEVTGTGDAGNTVEVTLEDGTIRTGEVDSEGTYSVVIPAQSAGSEISIVQEDDENNRSEGVTVIVRSVSAEEAFVDVTSSTGQYVHINALYQLGIINGFPDGTFRHNARLKRSEAAEMIYKALELSGEGNAEDYFTDVPPRLEKEIGILYNLDIVDGYTKTQFKPDFPLKREEMSKIVVEAFIKEFDNVNPAPFNDRLNTKLYPYLDVVYAYDIADGYSNGNFGVGDYIKRGNFAKMLNNAYEYWQEN